MNKREFKNAIKDGNARERQFMVIKIREVNATYPMVVIVHAEESGKKIRDYMKLTDDNLVFKDTGNVIEDVLFTNNLNDLNWFVY